MVVVDTNVAKVANGREESPQATPNCVNTCIGKLEKIMRGEETLVLDDRWIILAEYIGNLRSSGKPGTGDRFLRWVLINKDKRCHLVSITTVNGLENEFKEFPDDKALNGFHSKDRKFVAVALAHAEKPPILQATDTQWWEFRHVLRENGVTVKFICEDDIHRSCGET